MAKKASENEYRSYSVVLAEMMEVCESKGRPLNERGLRKAKEWFDPKEVIAVLGNGSAKVAVQVIERRWYELHPKKVKVNQEVEESKQVESEVKRVETVTEEAEVKVKRKRQYIGYSVGGKKATVDVLFEHLRRMQQYYSLSEDVYPLAKQIDEYSEIHPECPSYRTFNRVLGPYMFWRLEFEKAGLVEPLLTKFGVVLELKKGPKGWPVVTVEMLYCCIRAMQEYYSLSDDEYPSGKMIKAYGQKHSWTSTSLETFRRVLGKRQEWKQTFISAGLINET